MSLFDWGSGMEVFVARDRKGAILGIYSPGHSEDAFQASEVAVEAWFIDGPEFGPTIFHRPEEAPDPTRP